MTVVHLSSEDMREFAAARAKDPAIARLHDLKRAEAERLGGLALKVYELHQGVIFGQPVMMTIDEVARRLDLPVSTAADLVMTVDDPAITRWIETREYKASEYARMAP